MWVTFLNPVDPEEVMKLLNQMDPKKSVGPNSIPTDILKLIATEISHPLSKIINLSFTTGIFPDCLKMSEIIPIHKKNSQLECSNYRPISLISNLSKLFEKTIYSRLYGFLTEFKCLHNLQFGFRAKHSTIHTLIKLTNEIQTAIDNNNFACGVFIDLQKAFDTVNHTILLQKLEYYGARGVTNKWFKSYLTNRKQYVKINGVKSNVANVSCGVPQGSVLGPLLFLVYINDLSNSTKHSTVFHFADDTNLLQTSSSLKTLNKHINHDLQLLTTWLRANKISLNTSKTKLILFRPKNKQITKHLNFRISGQKLNLSQVVKYLGIFLDEHLEWKPHNLQLGLKLSRANGMLSKIRHYVPRDTLFSIYYAIFSSHMTYGCQVWFQNNSTHTKQISILQNKALRIINFKDKRHNANVLYKGSKILKINDHSDLLNCLSVYDCLKSDLPFSLTNFVSKIDHGCHTRNSATDCLNIPQVNTTLYGLQSIKHRCIVAWNNLQKLQKSKPLTSYSKNELKNIIKSLLLQTYE